MDQTAAEAPQTEDSHIEQAAPETFDGLVDGQELPTGEIVRFDRTPDGSVFGWHKEPKSISQATEEAQA